MNSLSCPRLRTFVRLLLLSAFLVLGITPAFAHYSPRLGRWLSRDPLGEEGGFNLYAYCGNDPVNRHDPVGLSTRFLGPNGGDYSREEMLLLEAAAEMKQLRETYQNPNADYLAMAAFAPAAITVAALALPAEGVTGLTASAYAGADWLLAGGGMQAISMWGARTALVVGAGAVAYDASQGASPMASLQHGAGVTVSLWSATGYGMPNLRVQRVPSLPSQRTGEVEGRLGPVIDMVPDANGTLVPSFGAPTLALPGRAPVLLLKQPATLGNTFSRWLYFTPSTGRTYKAFQRNDIDWGLIRSDGPVEFRGRTNAEAAMVGLRPQLADRSFVTLHHSQQSALGPLYEASTRYHHIGNAKRAPLHPFHGQQHPYFPLGRGPGSLRNQFQDIESPEYWMWRVLNR